MEQGKKDIPKTMVIMETVGAIASPVSLGKITKTAPLGIKSGQATSKAIKEGALYGFGSGEGYAKEQATSTMISSGSSFVGNRISRTINKNITRAFINPKVTKFTDDLTKETSINLINEILNNKNKNKDKNKK